MFSSRHKYADKESQTTIRVRPHFLESNKVKARVTCEDKTQTQISIKPEEDAKLYYSMFEYIPFQDIQECNKRVLNLPRKYKLQFAYLSKLKIDQCLFDDDGVNELFIELKEREKAREYKESKVLGNDMSTQTE